ncbi:hypothetical protein H0H81_002982 [Sphagnurus paluster]|uniref:WD40 repeat-like protein n=1 Tax=Sphagnurus paluster TaxID=117069 RepID=A0A9P7K6F3_9AGAR|nr:hypothetical protein H0H81_002982 [Sphagnurus paluster]
MARTKQSQRAATEPKPLPSKKPRIEKEETPKPRAKPMPKATTDTHSAGSATRSKSHDMRAGEYQKSQNPKINRKGKANQTVAQDEDEAENDACEDAIASTSNARPQVKKPSKKTATPTRLPTSFKIIAGSYEKLLYGLECTLAPAPTPPGYTFALKPTFIFPAHVSCIKAVAASPEGGKWLATGSADEIIKVWDLRRRKEIGGLMHHEGSITHLLFPSRSHLLSASEDGSLCLFRARDWSVLRALKGHKGRVNAVAVHPSGKVALSVGRDKTLRMWDLMRGKGCASTKLGKEGEIVRWSTDGELFTVQAGSTIDIYTTSMDLLHTITHPSRLHDVRFCKRINGEGELLLAGAEDKHLSVYAISKDPETPPVVVARMTGHANRVKAVQTHAIAVPSRDGEPGTAPTSTTVVCTVSSDGKIHVYDLAGVSPSAKVVEDIEPVAVYDTKGTRLTCIALGDGEMEDAGKNGEQAGDKRKRGVDADEKEKVEVEDDEEADEDEWPSEVEDEEEEEDEGEEEGEAEMESD